MSKQRDEMMDELKSQLVAVISAASREEIERELRDFDAALDSVRQAYRSVYQGIAPEVRNERDFLVSLAVSAVLDIALYDIEAAVVGLLPTDVEAGMVC